MIHIPLLAHPLGWVVLGAGGYALYKSGKKRGQKQAAAEKNAAVENADTQGEK